MLYLLGFLVMIGGFAAVNDAFVPALWKATLMSGAGGVVALIGALVTGSSGVRYLGAMLVVFGLGTGFVFAVGAGRSRQVAMPPVPCRRR